MGVRRIDEDWQHFRDVIDNKVRKALRKYIKMNRFVRDRADKKGQISKSMPQIEIPHFVHGDPQDGIGRGPGKKGHVFKKDPMPGEDSGAGQDEGEGLIVSIDVEEVLGILAEELELPDLKPKPNQTFEDIKNKYTSISLNGPESLRHTRRMMLQAMKRLAATGELDTLHKIPGINQPTRLLTPINSDKRYRQFKQIKIPSSNAVIMFARDGSGSMDDERCSIVSDMAWWIDAWIRRFYKRVERCYFWHDVEAKEVDEDTFYKLREGGGTYCSSSFKLMAEQFKNRFPPSKWNIYCFYFTDGDNWGEDNNIALNTLYDSFGPDVCNLFGVTQVLCYNYSRSLKNYLDTNMHNSKKYPNIRTVSIGPEESSVGYSFFNSTKLSEEDRNQGITNAIKALLGKGVRV